MASGAKGLASRTLGWVLTDEHVSSSDKRYQLKLRSQECPVAAEGQVLVKVLFAALNRRDHWIRLGMYPGIQFGSVLGADCCGVLVSPHTRPDLQGRHVIVDPGVLWGDNDTHPSPLYHILGMAPAPGTLQQTLPVAADHVYPLPAHLTPAQGAALPLAGLTAYRATVTKAQVRRGHCVLVTGIGGGVALFCLQFALALGATVWVTSSCPKKVAQAVSMGAAGGVLYTSADCKEQLKRLVPSGFDSVVDGAGGDAMNMYVSVLKIGGRISQYGATAGRPRSLHVTRMFLKNIELRGTSMGSPREFQAMLQLVTEARIVPVVSEIHPMEETLRAFDSLQRSSQFGKVVIRVSTGSSDDSMARPTPSSKL